ncbi:putative metalloprotease CJM1_0395 family protein [Halopseudomonas salina]|uniref:SprA-related family protein n=1 Tax=Halopseudomonas salina TaxID=1323744 RepID=A0ABQ1Q208_9GAMM|nr:putative metalloprotease CJM1_0395 family protein [Halopseudomonas salina]GGD10938.1 hypothetical protein GCM10007418_32410 [Halopseudomonas salina]
MATAAPGEGENPPSGQSAGIRNDLPGSLVGEGGVAKESDDSSQREAQVRQELASREARLEMIEQAEIQDLAARDREVRAHEQAHMAVGGQYAGGVSYDYSRGPDGRLYATGGSVSIDISPVSGDPAATINKMQQVQRAALAPAEPSGQDRVVAAQAAQLIAQARSEIASSTVEAEPRSAASGNESGEAETDVIEQPDAAPVVSGSRELATYRQIDSSSQYAQATFSASA